MFKPKLSSRILLYFLLVSLVPLVATNYILVTSANSQLVKAASDKQQAVAKYLSDNVSNYLTGNTRNLLQLSGVYLDGSLAVSNIDRNVSVLFQQYPDLQLLSILDSSGKEQRVFDSKGVVNELRDASTGDPYKAINFLSGKEYISSVNYDKDNNPTITIAVPILASDYKPSYSNSQPIETGIFSGNDKIKGTIVATYNIKNLWSTVLSTKIGENGYAYVIDGLGNLVAHPNSDFLASHKKLLAVPAAKQFIDGNFDTRQTISETDESVISTPKIIPNSGWAVIVEEPVHSINAGINSYIKLAATIGVVAIILSILASVFFRRQLTGPIKKLSEGAKRIGSGQFDRAIEINSKDELQDLAETFNSMGSNIENLIKQMKANNLNLGIEKTKLDNIINSVTDGIVALDQRGLIVSINPPAASLVQQEPNELIKLPISDAFDWKQDDQALVLELSNVGTKQYNDVTLEYGNQIAYLDLVVSIIAHRNSDVAAIVTIHNLTKSRELEFMKLDFVAIAAHELRTPLTVVRGYLDLLNEEAVKHFSVFNIENLQKIIYGVNELRDLINKLLNIARIERGEMEIFIEKLDLEKFAKANVHQHQTTAAQNQITLTYESNAEAPVYIPADPSSITEVMNNLVGNALKFNKKGNEVKVMLHVGHDEVLVEVSDDGPGIPNNLRGKLFTKFYRAERSLISGTRGTGLGLFISKTIIELQNGKIGIRAAQEKGTTFYFTLPIYRPEVHDQLLSNNKQLGGVHGWFKKNPNHRG